MKKTYTHPVSCTQTVALEPALMVTSGHVGSSSFFDDEKIMKRYNCPYAEHLYCEHYSKHMHEWAIAVADYAKRGVDYLFHIAEGCPFKDSCNVYQLYLSHKNQQNQK